MQGCWYASRCHEFSRRGPPGSRGCVSGGHWSCHSLAWKGPPLAPHGGEFGSRSVPRSFCELYLLLLMNRLRGTSQQDIYMPSWWPSLLINACSHHCPCSALPVHALVGYRGGNWMQPSETLDSTTSKGISPFASAMRFLNPPLAVPRRDPRYRVMLPSAISGLIISGPSVGAYRCCPSTSAHTHTLPIPCKDCTLHTPNVITLMTTQKQVLLWMLAAGHLSLEFFGPASTY